MKRAPIFCAPGPALALILSVAALAMTGCRGKSHAEIDGVLIPQADGVSEATAGPTLAVDVGTVAAAVVPPNDGVVRLAIGRKVPWDNVQALIAKVEATGARAELLVGQRHRVRAFALSDTPWPKAPRTINVISYIDGKACVTPPGGIEAKCVQSGDKRYIERAYLRELVREQVKMFDATHVEVELASGLHFADVVRTIDGARTCCFETKVAVRLKPQ